MNKLLSILTFCLLLGSLQAEKYGLIIAIGDYPEEGGWPDISSQNDVIHIRQALKILGFPSENISTIFDQDATKEGILNSINALQKKLKKGDVVYIHFSGHGQQVLDDNGDEIDNLDEAIVPYNSYIDYVEGFNEGQNLIRDDQIGAITEKMRRSCGNTGQVILILDSCHSGTGTRGMGKARGTDKVMAPKNYTRNTSSGEKRMGIQNLNDPNLAPMASFFGASSGELNFETLDEQANPVGSLSYSIATILANMESNFSFEEFFDRIKLKMKSLAPRQNPQWEGPENTYLFGGTLEQQERLYPIKSINNPSNILAEIGTILNVYENAKVAIVSLDQDKTVANGIVKKAGLMVSEIELDAPLEIREEELIKIKVTENCEPPIICNIHVDLDAASPWSPFIDEVQTASFVQAVHSNADLFITDIKNELSITTKEGDLVYKEVFNKSKSRNYKLALKKTLQSYTQGKILRSYNRPESNFTFNLEILETNCEESNSKTEHALDKESLSIPIGTCIKFKITNTGKEKAYFSLIDIQPDNVINLVIPAIDLGYTASEYFLEPGESYTTDYSIEIAEPYGDETLKLICSDAPLNLSGIINGSPTSRGLGNPLVNRNPFEALLESTYLENNTRGARVKKASAEQIGTETIYFKIIK